MKKERTHAIIHRHIRDRFFFSLMKSSMSMCVCEGFDIVWVGSLAVYYMGVCLCWLNYAQRSPSCFTLFLSFISFLCLNVFTNTSFGWRTWIQICVMCRLFIQLLVYVRTTVSSDIHTRQFFFLDSHFYCCCYLKWTGKGHFTCLPKPNLKIENRIF